MENSTEKGWESHKLDIIVLCSVGALLPCLEWWADGLQAQQYGPDPQTRCDGTRNFYQDRDQD